MIINHRKPSPSLNQGISRLSPSPLPFNSHILILGVFIIYFAYLVQILSRRQIYPPTKYNPQITYNIHSSSGIDGYIRFLILLQVLLLLQRALILKNTIPLLLHPHPSPSTFPTILRTYYNTISTLVSRYQCHSICSARGLLRYLALITT